MTIELVCKLASFPLQGFAGVPFAVLPPMRDAVAMTNFPGDAVKLELEIILNRFRCAAELSRLANVAEQENQCAEQSAGGEEIRKAALEEIERRVAETVRRHDALFRR